MLDPDAGGLALRKGRAPMASAAALDVAPGQATLGLCPPTPTLTGSPPARLGTGAAGGARLRRWEPMGSWTYLKSFAMVQGKVVYGQVASVNI